MFDPKDFPFNIDKMTEFFKNNDFASGFSGGKMPGNTDELIAGQKKNMEALVEANKAAAASYQELFTKQVEVFETTMKEAQAKFSGVEAPKMDAESMTAQSEAAKSAFEKALKNMGELATGAQKANADAMEIVTTRVQESVKEFQDIAKKSTK
ncbi:MAG: TIGR01841 family phasin [Rhodobacteraceae bacterium]|nr:TIGR01841 family phasin [Paracoccaceae bacterium]